MGSSYNAISLTSFVIEDRSKYQRKQFGRADDMIDLSADREVDYEFGQCKGDDGFTCRVSQKSTLPAGSSVRIVEVEVDRCFRCKRNLLRGRAAGAELPHPHRECRYVFKNNVLRRDKKVTVPFLRNA